MYGREEVRALFPSIGLLYCTIPRLYPALKLLEQLETKHLVLVKEHRWSELIQNNIAKFRNQIRNESHNELKNFLENVATHADKIGKSAFAQVSSRRAENTSPIARLGCIASGYRSTILPVGRGSEEGTAARRIDRSSLDRDEHHFLDWLFSDLQESSHQLISQLQRRVLQTLPTGETEASTRDHGCATEDARIVRCFQEVSATCHWLLHRRGSRDEHHRRFNRSAILLRSLRASHARTVRRPATGSGT